MKFFQTTNDGLNSLPFFVVIPLMIAVHFVVILAGSFLLSFPVGLIDRIAQKHPSTWGVLIGFGCLVALLALMKVLPKRRTYFELREKYKTNGIH